MFLGRSTQQWVGLISAAASTVQVLIVILVPSLDPTQVAVVLGAVTAFLGVLVAFIANTYTTPVNDPQLKAGTMVRVTDDVGTVVGHMPVPTP
jgi:hypothetical protein